MPASQAVVAKIAFNPSTLKFEASLGLQDEFQNSQGYTQNPTTLNTIERDDKMTRRGKTPRIKQQS